tara:strand:- start:1885 stop:2424 length:540 start_codon:yes stop_codon:yes gene_type:complete
MKNFKLKPLMLAAATVTSLSAFTVAHSSEIRGNINVSLTIGAGCAVNGQASAGVNTFGSIDFGEQSSLALFVDAESQGAAGGDIELTCNDQLAYSIALDDGLYSNAGQRRLSGGTNEFVLYDLYQDAARSVRWGSSAEAKALTGSGGPQALTIYGRIIAGQTTPSQGAYADTIRMTVNW